MRESVSNSLLLAVLKVNLTQKLLEGVECWPGPPNAANQPHRHMDVEEAASQEESLESEERQVPICPGLAEDARVQAHERSCNSLPDEAARSKPGERALVHASSMLNELPQPQPPGSQARTKPARSKSPQTAENGLARGCWLQGAGSALRRLRNAPQPMAQVRRLHPPANPPGETRQLPGSIARSL